MPIVHTVFLAHAWSAAEVPAIQALARLRPVAQLIVLLVLHPGELPVQVPGRSVRGERANFTRLVLDCIEAKVCK